MNIQEQSKELFSLIQSSNKILLINHAKMDPDAFWSLLWLYKIIEKLWKNVKATNDDSSPEDFNFLWWEEIINPELDIKEYNPDLVIALDAWSRWQLWLTYIKNEKFLHSKDFVAIDHHVTNEWYWDLNIVNNKASSTCEIIYELIKEADLINLIDKEIATYLITWIITDTNIFYNKNTTGKTLKISWELTELWAKQRLPIYNFYRKKEFNKTKLWAQVLNKMEKTDDWKIVWSIIDDNMFEETNTTSKETSGLINEFLANIEGSEMCFLLYSLDNWKTKASLRSESIDISKVCESFWWWWHKLAAGFTSKGNLKEVKKELLSKLKLTCK